MCKTLSKGKLFLRQNFFIVDLRFIVDLEFQVFSVHKPHEFLLFALDLHLECLIELRIERGRLFARLVRLNRLLELKKKKNKQSSKKI